MSNLPSREMRDFSEHVLVETLDLAVNMHLLEFKRRGAGPTSNEFDRAHRAAAMIASRADVLLFGGKPGEAAEVFNETAFAISVLACQPGGVALFGRHWEFK